MQYFNLFEKVQNFFKYGSMFIKIIELSIFFKHEDTAYLYLNGFNYSDLYVLLFVLFFFFLMLSLGIGWCEQCANGIG